MSMANRDGAHPGARPPWDRDGAPGSGPVPDWWLYRCSPEPHDGIRRLPPAPPWRSFSDPSDSSGSSGPSASAAAHGAGEPSVPPLERDGHSRRGRDLRAVTYQADREEIHLVNMALMLRRPLLVTGRPGVGKSTLAYSIARELRLGPVLRWPVTSRSTLQDGQYHYDAIGRLQEVNLRERVAEKQKYATGSPVTVEPPDIGQYLRLGPLGTALLPWRTPRVLLIDEIDKSDVDFPNDLLHVFEEGEFTIPELTRLSRPAASVMTADDASVELSRGRVRCHEFPLVIMTSNEEREFPPAFLRRCIRLEIRQPDRTKLARLVAAHLPPGEGPPSAVREQLITEFLRKQDDEGAELANDQLLNAVRVAQRIWNDSENRDLITDHLMRPLNEG
ncbi:AAA family ATPase [Streptomyces bacillaris]|uniref:AAA family ATPase n=1 Tax=Streptomyces bacillaris TaxID=68179 RepID=UPI0036FBF199